MVFTSHSTLHGKVIAVDHRPQSCRVTIELAGTPEVTAGIMKEVAVRLGMVPGEEIQVERDA